MSGLLLDLSRPATGADRRRFLLVATAVAGCALVLLAVIAMRTLPEQRLVEILPDGSRAYGIYTPETRHLAAFLVWPAQRAGVSLGLSLLVVPFALLGIQGLRTGTAARGRRLAALSLAGATRPQLRRLAVLEGTRAAVVGAVLAGPGYLVCWVVLGLLLPDGAKLLPRPQPVLLAAWPLLILLLGLAGGVAAGLSARPSTVSPLETSRGRPPSPGPGPGRWVLLAAALAVAGSLLALSLTSVDAFVALPVFLLAALVVVITAGPLLVQSVGRAAAARPGLLTSLAGRRLTADLRTPGRVAAVLLAVGIVVGVAACATAGLVVDRIVGSNHRLLLAFGTALIGALAAAAIAACSLVLGAVEQVVAGRRGVAVLVALAASPDFVVRVVRRQLLLTAVPPAALGALLGSLPFVTSAFANGSVRGVTAAWGGLLVGVVAAGCVAALLAVVASLAVRPAVRVASTPDNLRAA